LQVRLSSLAENSFNAVERVDEFSHITPEGKPFPDSHSGSPSHPGPDTVDTPLLLSLRRSNRLQAVPDPNAPTRSACDPPEGFPAAGKIVFDDVKMRYRPGLPLVLKGLSITIDAGTKVLPEMSPLLLEPLISVANKVRCVRYILRNAIPG
jgi:ABC-type multidrug transport system fused ATPase/permease subunit